MDTTSNTPIPDQCASSGSTSRQDGPQGPVPAPCPQGGIPRPAPQPPQLAGESPEVSRTFTATYDPSDNKLRLRSLHRLDAETYVRVRAAGFIHAPKQDLFVAPAWTPEREDLLLEMCGEIGDEDTSLVDRAEVRAERFEGYSERREDEAEAARQAVAALTDHIPLGQPILVGHHSERRARRDAERIENGLRKAVRLWETSKYWIDRAAGAIRHAKYKERADVRARRIKTIEADRRRAERARAYSIAARKLWESAPTAKGTRADGTPADFRDRALYLANHDRSAGFGLWSGLDKGEIRPEAAQASAVASHTTIVARSERLIQHCNHRLAYERALLAESGWTPPPKPKTKADLPLLNYPGTVKTRSRWHAGQIDTYEAQPMTKAEYAAIHTDYKGTAVSECGTHRVRTALITNPGGGRGLTAVYLTDSKTHERPTAEAQAERAAEEGAALNARMAAKLAADQARAAAGEAAAPARPAPSAGTAPFEAMKEGLRAGVAVVSAPQLFPTPMPLAARMARLAQLRPGDRVLEPSGGTGNIVRAVIDEAGKTGITLGGITAVEINGRLAAALAATTGAEVVAADFLTKTVEDLNGPFDRILMNPPFVRGADVDHVLHALEMLAAGGRLIAMVANGPKQEKRLRPVVEEMGGSWEPLAADTFEQQGTAVRAALIVVEVQS